MSQRAPNSSDHVNRQVSEILIDTEMIPTFSTFLLHGDIHYLQDSQFNVTGPRKQRRRHVASPWVFVIMILPKNMKLTLVRGIQLSGMADSGKTVDRGRR